MPQTTSGDEKAELVWWQGQWYEEATDDPPDDYRMMLLFNGNRPCEVCGGPSAVSPADRCWKHRHIGAKSLFEILAEL